MGNEDNNNRDWNINVNLSGLQAPTGSRVNLGQGYFKAEVTDMYEKPEKPGRVVILLKVNEGNSAGATAVSGLNIPKSPEDNVRYYWRGFAESAGYEPAQLDAGEVTLSNKAFLGKTVCFFFTPKELTTDGYDSVDFLPPAEWSKRAASFTPTAAPASGGNSSLGGGPTALGGAATLGGGSASSGTTSANDVRAKLGL